MPATKASKRNIGIATNGVRPPLSKRLVKTAIKISPTAVFRNNLSDNDITAGGITFIHPHSMYLSVFFQGGLVGVVLFAVVVIGTLRELLRHYDHADAKLALGILGIALPAYLLDGHELIDKVGSTWLLFWMPVAISLGFRWSQPAR